MLENVKMVICDLDGTLLYNSKTITDYTKQTIRELRKRGILFGICSGRPAGALKDLIRQWGIEEDVDFMLGFNGAAICDPKTGEVEEDFLLDPKQMPQIERSFDGIPVAFAQYHGREMFSTRSNPIVRQMARRNNLTFHQVSPKELERSASKLMAVGMPWQINRYLKSGRAEKLKGCRMFRSGPFLLEIVHPKLSKLEGVKKAAKHYGLSLDEIVTFGNDNNDLEMLQGTIGVAMKNALPEIKEAAKFVTEDTNKQDGVARFIRRQILGERQ